jgi:FkbM family methyltransferase
VLPADAGTILDLGANVGLAAVYFAALYPNARIVSYEPDPVVAARAMLNVGHPPAARRDADCGDSARTTDPRACFETNRDSWSTGKLGTGEPFTAPKHRAPNSAPRVAPVDILKLDIEGSEHESIEACSNLRSVRLILGEVHPAPRRSPAAMIDALDGFELVEHERA